jgi:hypothetical protein
MEPFGIITGMAHTSKVEKYIKGNIIQTVLVSK